MKKRVIGIIMSVCMAFSCTSIDVNANEFEQDDTGVVEIATETDALAVNEEETDALVVNAEETDMEQLTTPSISCITHVANIGWMNAVTNGEIAGTTGRSLAIEALKLSVSGVEGLGIRYAAHGQDYGWQDWVNDGAVAGTTGKSKRVEAIKIELTGDNAALYDVYYRAHVSNVGWLDWTCNGAVAGSYGLGLKMEALQIHIVQKGDAAPGNTTKPCIHTENVNYEVHQQNYGWLKAVSNGNIGGVTGKSLRLEALKISLPDLDGVGVKYCAHVQDIGWMGYVSDGQISGTHGQSKRVEAIKIELTGAKAANYNIWYRTHVQDVGWTSWVSNGAVSGTTGLSRRIEAIQIMVYPAGISGPSRGAATVAGSAPASEASKLARQKLNQVGWDLKSAFDYAAGLSYYRNVSVPPSGKHLETYVVYGFKNNRGNCYVMAATFCQMARELGYQCYLVEGYVPKRGGGTTVHGWAEIVVNGKTYVCDPDFTHETKKNGYMITYGTSGTWIYQNYSRVN